MSTHISSPTHPKMYPYSFNQIESLLVSFTEVANSADKDLIKTDVAKRNALDKLKLVCDEIVSICNNKIINEIMSESSNLRRIKKVRNEFAKLSSKFTQILNS